MSMPTRRRAGIRDRQPGPPQPVARGGERGWRGPFGWKIWQTALALAAALVVALVIFTLVVAASLPDPSTVAVHAGEVTLLDQKGRQIATVKGGGEQRQEVALAQVSPLIQHATVAAEDRNFYIHAGIDWGRLIKAMTLDLIRRRAVSGASTITEQLAKNVLLTPKGGLPGRTLTRKFKEAILATEIEQRFSKDKILELYLNSIYYGHHAYGVQAASKVYFNKDARDVTLGQASLLAGLPQAPAAYDPQVDYQTAKDRQSYVLSQMVRDGYIQEQEASTAKQEDLRPQLVFKQDNVTGPAPHFVDYVVRRLEKDYGADVIAAGGVAVTTSLDLDVQNAANNAVHAGEPRLERFGVNNAAMLVEEPRSGRILAMVGSADFNNDKISGQVNIAGPETKRQPGSSFKPYVYLTGVANKKFNTVAVFHDTADEARSLNPGGPAVHDFDNRYEGTMRMRTALVQSRNVPAEEAMQRAGPTEVVNMVKTMGISTEIKPFLSSAIGASEVTMLDHAEAYGVLANQGSRHAPVSILKVVDGSGKDITAQPAGGEPVVDPGAAYIVNDILKDYNQEWNLGFDRVMAAKSGTTNIQNPNGSISTGDGWLMAYNPGVVIASWAGHTSSDPTVSAATKNFFGVTEGQAIISPFLRSMKDRWQDKFVRPGNVTIGNCGGSGGISVPERYAPAGGEYLLAGDSAGVCPTPSAAPSPSRIPSPTPAVIPTPSALPSIVPSPLRSPTPRVSPT